MTLKQRKAELERRRAYELDDPGGSQKRQNDAEELAIKNEEMNRTAKAAADLIHAADSAADWLCDAAPGTDQRERGDALRKALKAFTNRL